MRAPGCTLTATSEPEESSVNALPFTALTVPMRFATDCGAASCACAAVGHEMTEPPNALHTIRSANAAIFRFMRPPYFTLPNGPQMHDLQSFTQEQERLQRTKHRLRRG